MGISEQRRDRYRRIANKYRTIPGEHGLRVSRVYLLHTAWTGGKTGDGIANEIRTELTNNGQPPRVRQLSDEQLAIGSSADNIIPSGTIEIGPLTPTYTGGGTAIADLIGTALDAGETLHVELVGPAGTVRYVITKRFSDMALHYKLQAQPVGTG